MKNYDLILLNGVTYVDPQAATMRVAGGDAVLKVGAQMLRGGNDPYHEELQYLGLLQELVNMADNDPRPDRTGTGTYSVFGRQMRFNLQENFPLLTTKRLHTKAIFYELAWMLQGRTDVKWLQDRGVSIWDEWADENGELGPVYGAQWRAWPRRPDRIWDDIDQIKNLIEGIKSNPNGRRHIVTAWNPGDIEDMRLPPCHCFFQMYVDEGRLSCQLYQRSADIFLGVPFNIASYALLVALIAKQCGLHPGEFIHTFGDLHLYANHVDQAREQLTRTPKSFPHIKLAEVDLFSFSGPEDVAVLGYDPHPAIKAEVSI